MENHHIKSNNKNKSNKKRNESNTSTHYIHELAEEGKGLGTVKTGTCDNTRTGQRTHECVCRRVCTCMTCCQYLGICDENFRQIQQSSIRHGCVLTQTCNNACIRAQTNTDSHTHTHTHNVNVMK